MALSYAKVNFEPREVELKNKPLELIKISSKATVPVLILEDGQVLEESLDIIKWALKRSDPDGWMVKKLETQANVLIRINDTQFKPLLDYYKYPQKSEKKDPLYYRELAKTYLKQLNDLLRDHQYLLGDHLNFADVAIFPFIRQFYMVDVQWFEESDYKALNIWLHNFLNSELFLHVMAKP